MQDPGMGSGDKGAGFGRPGLSELMEEELPIPAQGDCVHLSTRVNLDCHGLGAVLNQ